MRHKHASGKPMSFHVSILTLFPQAFPGPLTLSVCGRALAEDIWALDMINLREFGSGPHRKTDDTPAGGGAGMVMRADTTAKALDSLPTDSRPRLFLSPRGAPLDQERVRRLSQGAGMVLLCGRFEGLDQRVIEARKLEEVSIGDFVLAGGEIAAMALTEACVRLLPGVAGNADSLTEESFEHGLLEYPHYTRPSQFESRSIPPVLLSGDHGAIAKWRREQAEALTRAKRPDLYAKKRQQT